MRRGSPGRPRPASETQQADESWQFVADIEVRNEGGTPVATQVVRVAGCTPDAEIPDGCAISWSWPEEFTAGSVEWFRSYFEVVTSEGLTETIHVASMDHEYPIAPTFCATTREVPGGPSGECLAALSGYGVERDGRGYYNNGLVAGGSAIVRHAVFFEPLAEELAEWWESCPLPPPTHTPQLTYTPRPTYTPVLTPTCRPTWTPAPPAPPLPTDTPYPTATGYPTQPPW